MLRTVWWNTKEDMLEIKGMGARTAKRNSSLWKRKIATKEFTLQSKSSAAPFVRKLSGLQDWRQYTSPFIMRRRTIIAVFAKNHSTPNTLWKLMNRHTRLKGRTNAVFVKKLSDIWHLKWITKEHILERSRSSAGFVRNVLHPLLSVGSMKRRTKWWINSYGYNGSQPGLLARPDEKKVFQYMFPQLSNKYMTIFVLNECIHSSELRVGWVLLGWKCYELHIKMFYWVFRFYLLCPPYRTGTIIWMRLSIQLYKNRLNSIGPAFAGKKERDEQLLINFSNEITLKGRFHLNSQ